LLALFHLVGTDIFAIFLNNNIKSGDAAAAYSRYAAVNYIGGFGCDTILPSYSSKQYYNHQKKEEQRRQQNRGN
jgi:hypothetical protein